MLRFKWDIIFILALTAFLLVLSETGNLQILMKLPFVTIYIAYGIGRTVGELNKKRIQE